MIMLQTCFAPFPTVYVDIMSLYSISLNIIAI